MIGRLPVCASISRSMSMVASSAASRDALKGQVDVVAALRGLDEGELRAGAAHGGPVDAALVARYVDAVDRQLVRPRHRRMRPHVPLGGVIGGLAGAGAYEKHKRSR